MSPEPHLWAVLFYRDPTGTEPVREWLDDLVRTNPLQAATVRHRIDLLAEFGVLLEEPYTRQLSGKLRELRAGSWRITYFCDPKRRFVLLTFFVKKSRATNPNELKKAKRLMNAYLEEMEER